MRPQPDKRAGIVDIGSNSIRLVVYDGLRRVPNVLFNERAICGLGRGLRVNGRLDADGMAMALENLERFAALVRSMQVEEFDILATAAVREAGNGDDFVRRVERIFDHPVRVLSGAEEGRLAATGVLAAVPDARGVAGDLGGGSLELAVLNKGTTGNIASLSIGPFRLMDQAGGDRIKARRLVNRELKDVGWLKKQEGKTFYAVGGAWRALARLHMAQTDYPLRLLQGYRVPIREIRQLADLVSRQSVRSLAKIKDIPNRRVETLSYAAIVLIAVLKRMKPSEVIFSTSGLREGCLLDSLPKQEMLKDPLETVSCEYETRLGRFGRLSKTLEAWIAPLFAADGGADKRRLRLAACRFSDIAWREHPDYRAVQALQRILWMPLYALDHPGRAYIALAVFVRYGGRVDDEAAHAATALLTPEDADEAALCGAALRLAYAVSGGAKAALKHTRLIAGKGELKLKIEKSEFFMPGDTIARRLANLARAGGYKTSAIEE